MLLQELLQLLLLLLLLLLPLLLLQASHELAGAGLKGACAFSLQFLHFCGAATSAVCDLCNLL